ncbi:DUF2809 domain-containing protein [Pseudoflavitalea sp. X16]|uniref:ribosomal maturation YjgA family protein n=1 Tax=Paraflavitalea devenefica TaxID=2716334 RepID=UPI001422D0D4|nr:DUF2809 domain-containing protein [Paraflavitalea devenefica]NII27966.1 DUF2809 domain-containing protein [Paraflavitalea devenefica]
MFQFNKRYFLIAILLFIIEVLIALYVQDAIIRPYVGDFLVVILLYCLLKAFLNISLLPAAISVLLFAYLIEILQYFHLVHRLGLQHSKLATTVIGSSFEWIDLIAYTAGIIFTIIVEKRYRPAVQRSS